MMAGKTGCGVIRIHKAEGEESRKRLAGAEMVSSLKMSLFIPAKEHFLCLVALASCMHICCKQHLSAYWRFLMVLWRETSLDSQQLPLFRRPTFLLPGVRENLFRFVLGPSTGRSCFFPW